MPKKKKKSQRIILTQHPIDLSDADVVPPKLRRKREALPIIKKKIRSKRKDKGNREFTSTLDGGPSLVDVIIDQHNHGDSSYSNVHDSDILGDLNFGNRPSTSTTIDPKQKSSLDDNQTISEGAKFVLRMALSDEERRSSNLYTRKELQWRRDMREKEAFKKRRKQMLKRKSKVKSVTGNQRINNERPEVTKDSSLRSPSKVTSRLPSRSSSRSPSKLLSRSPSRSPSKSPSKSPSRKVSPPSRDRVFNEFRQLLFATDGVRPLTKVFDKSREFKEQFRGGNPFFSKLKDKKKCQIKETSIEEQQNENKKARKRKLRLGGKYEYQDDGRKQVFYCRKCVKILPAFSTELKTCIVTCDCGYLNNRKHFIHVNEKREIKKSTSLPLIQSHAEMSRNKFKLKLRDRFLEDMNDVISRLSKSTITKTSPGKRIWKEFDQTQQRLAHTWKQPTPGPQYYGTPFEGSYNQRILSHAKSKPSFNL